MRMRISSSLRQSTNLYEGRGDKLTSSSISFVHKNMKEYSIYIWKFFWYL